MKIFRFKTFKDGPKEEEGRGRSRGGGRQGEEQQTYQGTVHTLHHRRRMETEAKAKVVVSV